MKNSTSSFTHNSSSGEGRILQLLVQSLYAEYGQRKSMGQAAQDLGKPHFFLHRTFLVENDLLIIFNTKRCKYQCWFCQLPQKSSKSFIDGHFILEQFSYVLQELKHSLSVLDRVTLSNEGSVLDADTFPTETLMDIIFSIRELRRVRTLTLESRLEFFDSRIIREIRQRLPKVQIDILTGFETRSEIIRNNILNKRESIDTFLNGLDRVAQEKANLTAYVLFKSDPLMNDAEAYEEAKHSIEFLVDACKERNISLTVRLNPIYLAQGSRWTKIAKTVPNYQSPRLSDVLSLAKSKYDEGVSVYIGLSTEGLAEDRGDYRSREDFSSDLLRQAILFNNRRF